MTTADLGYPILVTICVFWILLAALAFITSLLRQGKISGRMLKDKFSAHSHKKHPDLS